MSDHRSVVVSKRVLAGATLAALGLTGSMLFASSATADPTSPECFQARANVASQQNVVNAAATKLSNDNVLLQNAKNKLAQDQAVVPVNPALIAADQNTINILQQTVNNDQASLATAQANLASATVTRDTVCGTVVVTTTPTTTTVTPPPTTVTPPPGQIFYATCAQALAAVGHPLREGVDPGYRLALDRDQDGLACEAVEGNPPSRVVYYANCAIALDAVGHVLVEGRDPGYRIGLDRDQDGIACEANEGPAPAAVILNCPLLKDRGIALPVARGNVWYRGYLDANHNGWACEIIDTAPPVVNNTTINNPPPTNTTTIVNPPAAQGPTNVYVVPPAPSGPGFSQIQQPPAGAVQTGDGSSLLR